jgi:flavin reductase (DIM6/NTAB) family NADH-FMN oxidoreductase RutF
MTVSGDDLRRWLRQWASGVTLVTAQDGANPHGMTVSSFASLSLDPPLIMVSLEQGARTHRMVRESGRFAVVMLRDTQQDLAERFAGGVPDSEPRFDGVPHRLSPGGSPIPDVRLAYLDCRVVDSHAAGTHTIFIGQVVGGEAADGGHPLLYYNRGYRGLADQDGDARA